MNKTFIKYFVALLCFNFLFTGSMLAQKKLIKETSKIVEEGKLLYKSEMTSWYGTDIFLANYPEKENIHGYFSYSEKNHSKCVFFTHRDDKVTVIGTITFKDEYSVEAGNLSLEERDLTKKEMSLYEIRQKGYEEIRSDDLFKTYKNTNLNLIPLIQNGERKLYILTGPEVHGVVIFGNDYLITFNDKNEVTSKKELHKNIIPIEYGEHGETSESIHSHTTETGDFITATDICTLMLYSKFTGWKTHKVVSKRFLNQWDCITNTLSVVSMKTIKKIQKNSKKDKN